MRRVPNGLVQGTARQTFLRWDDGELCELTCVNVSARPLRFPIYDFFPIRIFHNSHDIYFLTDKTNVSTRLIVEINPPPANSRGYFLPVNF